MLFNHIECVATITFKVDQIEQAKHLHTMQRCSQPSLDRSELLSVLLTDRNQLVAPSRTFLMCLVHEQDEWQ